MAENNTNQTNDILFVVNDDIVLKFDHDKGYTLYLTETSLEYPLSYSPLKAVATKK